VGVDLLFTGGQYNHGCVELGSVVKIFVLGEPAAQHEWSLVLKLLENYTSVGSVGSRYGVGESETSSRRSEPSSENSLTTPMPRA